MVAASSETALTEFHLPPGLVPVPDRSTIDFTPAFINDLHTAGISGVGVALPIFDSNGKILFGEHNITPNNPTVSWGPLTETMRWSPDEVESLWLTAARCIDEELGVEPNDLQLWQYGSSPLLLSIWKRRHQRILAISVPLTISDKSRDVLLSQPPSTPEIARVEFFGQTEALTIPNLREGADDYTRYIGSLGLFASQPIGGQAVFPELSAIADGSYQDTDKTRTNIT